MNTVTKKEPFYPHYEGVFNDFCCFLTNWMTVQAHIANIPQFPHGTLVTYIHIQNKYLEANKVNFQRHHVGEIGYRTTKSCHEY